jgi:phosphoglycolate phosphatase-like HAD superfamily hydrolase
MNFIFDFDGTLADSLPAMISVFNKNIRGGVNPLTEDEILMFRNLSSRQAINKLGVRWWQVPRLILQGIPDFRALVPTLKTFEGLPAALAALQNRGDKLFIVTSNTRDSVDEFLEHQKLESYFTEIITGAGLFKKSKHIRRLIKTYGLKRKETFYVGDETRDIQAARLSRIKVISVAWGFNTKAALMRRKPNYIVDKPEDLLSISVV